MLYQLSYFRKNKPHQSAPRCLERLLQPRPVFSGKRWIRTTEGVRQQIYSLPHLATLVSSQFLLLQLDLPLFQVREPMEGFEPTTPRLQITCSGQLSYIGIFTVTGCKGRYFFLISKLFLTFFSKILFRDSKHRPASLVQRTFDNSDFYKLGKSSANIATLCELKNIVALFFRKKLKKNHFRRHLYI